MLHPRPVFTYWEGPFPLVNRTCVSSIRRVFGDRHVHVTPETLGQFVDTDEFPAWVFKTNIGFRSDMIRIFLLRKYGGWWLDCDILLRRDPSELLVDHERTHIWKEVVSDEKFPGYGACAAVLYTPKGSAYIREASRRGVAFEGALSTDPTSEDGWVHLMRTCLIKPIVLPEYEVVIGDEKPFYNMDHYQNWWKCWDGSLPLSQFSYGVQFNTSLIRRAMFLPPHHKQLPAHILSLTSLEELQATLPRSNLAEYIAQSGLKDAELFSA